MRLSTGFLRVCDLARTGPGEVVLAGPVLGGYAAEPVARRGPARSIKSAAAIHLIAGTSHTHQIGLGEQPAALSPPIYDGSS